MPNNETTTPLALASSAIHQRRHLLNMDIADLCGLMVEWGEKPFRATQIRKWLFHKRASSFEDMSDLPKGLRERLSEHLSIFQSKIVSHQKSTDGTEKLLVRLVDGGEVECVLLRDGDRRSICVSSQVGCAMGCVFCASGLDGVQRSLSSGEIIEQMLLLQTLVEPDSRLSHIVMMGMGEPLANLSQVLRALDVARDQEGLGISPRRITISTVGLPPSMDKLAEAGIPYNLAVSLHAPNDELRNVLVPVNQKIGIEAVLRAADRYFNESGRRLTYEYVLLGGLNDSALCAKQLANLLRHRGALLNVIPYNSVAGLPYETPSSEAISRFRSILEDAGVNVQFRQRKGDEINAACGQLRRNRQNLVSLTAPLVVPSL